MTRQPTCVVASPGPSPHTGGSGRLREKLRRCRGCCSMSCINAATSEANQVSGYNWQSVKTTLGPAIFERDVAALDIAGFVETSQDGVMSAGVTVCAAEQLDHRHRRLLRAPPTLL